MKIKRLNAGTKLVWDAPEPYAGYAEKHYGRIDGRVVHAATILFTDDRGTCLMFGDSRHYMSNKQIYLRYPTESELSELVWYELKKEGE